MFSASDVATLEKLHETALEKSTAAAVVVDDVQKKVKSKTKVDARAMVRGMFGKS